MPPMNAGARRCGPARPCRRAGRARGSTSRDRAAARCARAAAACRRPCGGSCTSRRRRRVASASAARSLSIAALFASWFARNSGDRGSTRVVSRGYGCSAPGDSGARVTAADNTRRAICGSVRRHGERDRGSEVGARQLPHLQEANRQGRAPPGRRGLERSSAIRRAWRGTTCCAPLRSCPASSRKRWRRTPARSRTRPSSRPRWPTRSRRASGKPGGFPYVDKAPTGRAKCMQCEEPIAKDSFRVAVEREIDTGSMVTRGAGYMHPKCAVPNLENTGGSKEELSRAFARTRAWRPRISKQRSARSNRDGNHILNL